MHACARYRQQSAGNITRVLKGNLSKTINMALERKFFLLINGVSIVKRGECSLTLLTVDKKSSCLGTVVFYRQENCVFLTTPIWVTRGGTQRNNYKSTCSLPSLWLISVATVLVFGLSRHKVTHPAVKENDADHALTKCRLERKRKVLDKMRSLRASKCINAEPPAKQKSPPGRDEEPTDSQVSSFTMEAIDVGHHCHM